MIVALVVAVTLAQDGGQLTGLAGEPPAEPVRCKVGAFLYGMSQFNVAASQVDVDLYTWVWCPKTDAITPADMKPALVGASNESRDDLYETEMAGGHYRYERIRATLRVAQDLRKYPFDQQKVGIDLESSVLSSDFLVFEIDDDPALMKRPRCCIDESVQLSEWVITKVTPSIENHVYETRFGIRSNVHAREYSRFSIDIVAQRIVAPYLLKVMFPLLLILAVAYLTWWFKADDLDAVTSLLVTCLLAAVALHLAQASALPNVGYLVMSDWFFLHTYAMLLLMLGLFTAGYRAANSDRMPRAEALQRFSRWAVPLLLLLGWAAPFMLR